MRKNPKYVRLSAPYEGTALCLEGKEYVRYAGAWSVHFKRDAKGVLRIHEPKSEQLKHLHGVMLIEITKEQHDKDNRGYL